MNYDLSKIARILGKERQEGNKWRSSCPLCPPEKNASLQISLNTDGSLGLFCYRCQSKNIFNELVKRGIICPLKPNNPYKNSQNSSFPTSSQKIDSTEAEAQAKRRQAIKIWEKESVCPKGTLVEKYLDTRGLQGIAIPDSIRFNPFIWNMADGRWVNEPVPSMVAKIQIYPTNEIIGIQRTFLKPDGSGKIDGKDNKMIRGSIKGGAVQFGEDLECIGLCEGIEDALSCYKENYSMTWWALLGTSNFKNVILPPPSITKEIVIIADHDEPGIKAAEELGRKLHSQGYIVRLGTPNKPRMDANDLLMQEG